jgi:transposase
MAALIPDELWNEIRPMIPRHAACPQGGRPRVDDRQALTGIVFVLKSGIAWSMVPAEMGCGSGVTCWRRLREWTAAGVWPAIHARLLGLLGKAGGVDAARAVVDSASVRAVLGGRTPDRTRPTAAKKAASVTC